MLPLSKLNQIYLFFPIKWGLYLPLGIESTRFSKVSSPIAIQIQVSQISILPASGLLLKLVALSLLPKLIQRKVRLFLNPAPVPKRHKHIFPINSQRLTGILYLVTNCRYLNCCQANVIKQTDEKLCEANLLSVT